MIDNEKSLNEMVFDEQAGAAGNDSDEDELLVWRINCSQLNVICKKYQGWANINQNYLQSE